MGRQRATESAARKRIRSNQTMTDLRPIQRNALVSVEIADLWKKSGHPRRHQQASQSRQATAPAGGESGGCSWSRYVLAPDRHQRRGDAASHQVPWEDSLKTTSGSRWTKCYPQFHPPPTRAGFRPFAKRPFTRQTQPIHRYAQPAAADPAEIRPQRGIDAATNRRERPRTRLATADVPHVPLCSG
jgi:hypothetical protein